MTDSTHDALGWRFAHTAARRGAQPHETRLITARACIGLPAAFVGTAVASF